MKNEYGTSFEHIRTILNFGFFKTASDQNLWNRASQHSNCNIKNLFTLQDAQDVEVFRQIL